MVDDNGNNMQYHNVENDDDEKQIKKAISCSSVVKHDDDNVNLHHHRNCNLKTEAFNHFSDETKQELKIIMENAPMFNLTEDDIQIQYRNKLGEGAFCSVFPVRIKNHKTNTFNEDLPPAFAIKKLRLDVAKDANVFNEAYTDLHQEAIMMKDLQHGSIITLFGMSDVGDESRDGRENFFIIMEKLESTLVNTLVKWYTEDLGLFTKIVPANAVKTRLERVALGIASGLKYLHSRQIVYRDIKPANIGFDFSGNVKLFDFGLAISLPSVDEEDGGCGKIQGKAGTIRYMAPEMKQGKPYSHSVDVYSFAVLLWQIVTSRIPFEKEIPTMAFLSDEEGMKDTLRGVRPDLQYIENNDLSSLLETCWNEDPEKRWSFDEIESKLERIIWSIEQAEKLPSDKKSNFFSGLSKLILFKPKTKESYSPCIEVPGEKIEQNRDEKTYSADVTNPQENFAKMTVLDESASREGGMFSPVCCCGLSIKRESRVVSCLLCAFYLLAISLVILSIFYWPRITKSRAPKMFDTTNASKPEISGDIGTKYQSLVYVEPGDAGATTIRQIIHPFCDRGVKNHSSYENQNTQGCSDAFERREKTMIFNSTVAYVHDAIWDPYEKMKDATVFLWSIRDPMDRIVSALYHRTEIENVSYLSSQLCLDEKLQNTTKYRFYCDCFIDHDLEQFAKVLNSSHTDERNVIIENNEIVACSEIAWKALGSSDEHFNEDIGINYQHCYEESIARYPEKEIMVIRYENMWDDLQQIEQLLGGNLSQSLNALTNMLGSKQDDTITQGLSADAIQSLCCAIQKEVILYVELLNWATNLDFIQRKESVRSLEKRCNLNLCLQE